ncbi:RWD domain-containing protein 2B [Hypomesus transpacificus]|uniref:RWD domain-containing protein 2B n=1 Tax=Hypomesus transpacificus TaxID=137520 RepID=UPI001F07D140|nr:RWD domain-containing protein 2B [Hypomesus transpacificus]XP_046873759.1 RWD domain-containing protein 2B [Hypomesus transpacificus]
MAHVEWAEAQIAEIDLLSSMFPSLEEFEITDQLALAELVERVDNSTNTLTSRPQFVIKLKIGTVTKEVIVTIHCTYPSEYPTVLPEITIRCSDLNRTQQTQLHSDLNTYLIDNCCGEVCVLFVVGWVRDNAHLYIENSSPTTWATKSVSDFPPTKDTFTRLWIYSHHIYNKMKRKNIMEWSKELELTGFSMPGKPGIVCVEGSKPACEEFWARVKVLTWKKIMIRHREDFTLDNQDAEGRTGNRKNTLNRFTGFKETMFDPHGNRGNHMDLGQLYQFLNDKGCGNVFQLYFGIEGK